MPFLPPNQQRQSTEGTRILLVQAACQTGTRTVVVVESVVAVQFHGDVAVAALPAVMTAAQPRPAEQLTRPVTVAVAPTPVCMRQHHHHHYYYYYYAAFNAPRVGHKDDESQAQAWGVTWIYGQQLV